MARGTPTTAPEGASLPPSAIVVCVLTSETIDLLRRRELARGRGGGDVE